MNAGDVDAVEQSCFVAQHVAFLCVSFFVALTRVNVGKKVLVTIVICIAHLCENWKYNKEYIEHELIVFCVYNAITSRLLWKSTII